MKKMTLLAVAAASVMALSATPSSAKINVAVGPKISTLGFGVEATAKITEKFNFRTGVNYFKLSKNIPDGKIDYDASLRFLTVSALVDFHPFANGFRLSAGAMYNGNKFTLDVTPTKNVTFEDVTYTPAQMGKIEATLDFRKVSPYLGIGYDSAMHNDGNWSFNAEAGVLFQGKPKASVKSSALVATQGAFIEAAKNDLQNNTNKGYFRFYPVVSIGAKYRF